MSDSIKTVKLKFDAVAEPAKKAIASLAGSVKELKGVYKSVSSDKSMSSAAESSAKASANAIDAQVRKIIQLKTQMNSLKSMYKDLGKAEATRAKAAEARDSYRERLIKDFSGFNEPAEAFQRKIETNPELQQLSENARQAFMEVANLKRQITELTGTSAREMDVNTALFSMNEQIKAETANLRELQKEEEKSGESAKNASSKHHSFAQALKNVGHVLKNIKSHIQSALSGLRNFASSVKGAIPHANKFGGALGKLASTFKRLFVMRVLRNLITSMIKGFKEGIDNVVRYSAALNGLDANNANKSMSEFASTTAYLKNVLGSAAIPILNQLLPIIRAIATAFATAVNYVNQFFSLLGGKSTWTRAKQTSVDYASTLDGVGSSAGGAADKVKELQRTILGFDEINKLNGDNGSGSGGGSGGGGGGDAVNFSELFEEVPIEGKVMDFLGEFKDKIDDIKDAWGDVKDAVKKLVQSDGFKYLTSTIFNMALGGIKTALTVCSSLIKTITDILSKDEIKDKIGNISKAWDKVREAVEKLTSSEGFKAVLEDLSYMGLTALETVLTSVSGLLGSIENALNNLNKEGKLDALKKAFEKLCDAVSDLFNSPGFSAITDTVLGIAVATLEGLFNSIATIIRDIVMPVINDLAEMGVFEDIKNAVSEIWQSIQNICNSTLFQSLVSLALEHTIVAISTAVKLIADALEIIEGILTFDFDKAAKGFVKVIIDAIGGLVEMLAGAMDAIFGWNTKEHVHNAITAARNSIENDTSYQDELYALEHPGEGGSKTHTSSSGTSHGGGTNNSIVLEFIPSVKSDMTAIQEWKDETWANLKPEDRELAFQAMIDSSAQWVSKAWEDEAWNTLSEEEKQLAWEMYIATSGEDIALEFSDGWNSMDDKNKFLAFLAYVNSRKPDVIDDYIEKYWTPDASGKKLPMDVEIDATKEENKPKKVSEDYINQWNKAGVSGVGFIAHIDSTGDGAPAKLAKDYKDTWDKDNTKPKLGIQGTVTNTLDMWSDVNDTFENKYKPNHFKGIVVNKKDIWEDVNDTFENTYKPNHLVGTITNKKGIWSDVNDTFENQYNPNHLKGVFTNKLAMWSDVNTYFYNATPITVYGKAVIEDLSYSSALKEKLAMKGMSTSFASGGFVGAATGRFIDSAQIFTARENGIPEYVGKFGSHTAVANNYQIVSGIAEGVSQAMLSQNELLREQNALLAQIASNSGDITTASIVAGLTRQNRRAGTTVVPIGV